VTGGVTGRPTVPRIRVVATYQADGVVHYPFPGDETADGNPTPLCGELRRPTRTVPARSGERLCRKCRSKGANHFGW